MTSYGGCSVTDLPKPDGWKDRILVYVVGLLMLGLLGLFFAVKAFRALQHAHWLAATICLAAVVVSLISVVGAAWLLLAGAKLRASFDGAGTTLRAVPAAKYLVAVLVALVVGSGLFVMFNSQVRDEIPSDARDRGKVTVLFVIGVIGLGFMARSSRHAAPRLRLSADGVDYTDRYAPFTLTWAEISDITGLAPKGKTYRPVVFEVHGDRPPAVINNASAWAPDGAVLYWLIRHYWRHSADRGELSNGVAIERLRAGRVTAG